jgi:hypothetical protein
MGVTGLIPVGDFFWVPVVRFRSTPSPDSYLRSTSISVSGAGKRGRFLVSGSARNRSVFGGTVTLRIICCNHGLLM